MQLIIGPDAITSYRRLAYTPWHALAEFVDNSTQSYFDNRAALDMQMKNDDDRVLAVSIAYDKNDTRNGLLRVTDNAMGMSHEELERALHVARPPERTDGLSKYGMGMKTAAAWVGNLWTITTKKLGEDVEHTVRVDVGRVAAQEPDAVEYSTIEKDAALHYTIVEIVDLNRTFHGRTLGKIANFLRSMYRMDIQQGILKLRWRDQLLEWENIESKLHVSREGKRYRKPFSFSIGEKGVHGWVGILDKGSRADAGFAILQAERVVRGWPDAWRPSRLYGQFQGSNDLVNQRLVGEIHLDGFEVSHTKDNILWRDNEEDEVEKKLRELCNDYRDFAKTRRTKTQDERGPSDVDVNTALEDLENELNSPEMVDHINISEVPPLEAIELTNEEIIGSVVSSGGPTSQGRIMSNPPITWKVFLESMSVNDAYAYSDRTNPNEITVVVNVSHPFWTKELTGPESVRNYLRQCVYDSVAEWQARQKAASIDPDTVKLLKDRLMRVPVEMESHSDADSELEGEEVGHG